MNDTSLASIHDENFQLLIGDEFDVAAAELSALGRTVRFGPDELGQLARIIGPDPADTAEHYGLLVVADELDPEADSTVTADLGGGVIGEALRTAARQDREALLTEAVARGWYYRLRAATAGTLAWTREDSEQIGRLGIKGRPLLNAYLAERRLAIQSGGYTPQHPAVIPPEDQLTREVLCGLVDEAATRVQFGAAELAAVGEAELRTVLKSAQSEGDWLDNLRLVLAVEEALSADLLLEIIGEARVAGEPVEWARLRAAVGSRVLACRARVPLFRDVLERLQPESTSLLAPVIRRGELKQARLVGEEISAYLGVFTEEPDEGPELSPAAAREALADLTAAADSGAEGGEVVWLSPAEQPTGSEAEPEVELNLDGLGEKLGEQFTSRAPAVQQQLSQLRENYPGATAVDLLARLRRRTLAELDAIDAAAQGSEQQVSDIVVDYVLAQAMLRGVPATTEADFNKLGAKLLAAARNSVKTRATAETVGTGAGVVVDNVLPYVQELLIEFAFTELGRAKPNRPGAYRKVYNLARSRIWRLRKNSRVAAAATQGAEVGVRSAVDRGSNRLLLWSIDKQLKKVSR